MMLFCGIALLSTSCKDNNDNNSNNVVPEVETGKMTIGSNTVNIGVSKAVTYGQKNAIVLASKDMTAADNEGIAIIFEGDITPGTYTMGGNTKTATPRVVGFHQFNMGELPFIMGADTLYFGDTYLWISGLLSVTQNSDGSYTVILSQCVGTNAGGTEMQMGLNFTGNLTSYVFSTENKFTIGHTTYPIGLAATAGISSNYSVFDTIPLDGKLQSLVFLSANHKNCYIINYLSDDPVLEGEYSLTNLLPTFPYLGFAVFPHVMATTSFSLTNLQPSTAYLITDGTLKVSKDNDGCWHVAVTDARLTNLELPLVSIPGSLEYHGMMYELGLWL